MKSSRTKRPREYDPETATAFSSVLGSVSAVFEKHRSGLDGEVSPIQLWPHGFDLAFEWFGTRVETFEEDGEVTEYPSQLSLGFYPGGRPYFYSNPWPFDAENLVDHPLPHGARWHTEGWQGTILYYEQLEGEDENLSAIQQQPPRDHPLLCFLHIRSSFWHY